MSVLRIVLIAAVLPAAIFASADEGRWFPLDGVKSGQLLLSADFLDSAGTGTSTSGDGVAKLNVIKAKDLIKTDLIGKSDPYVLVKYGSQKDKTPVVKNSQNPEWNHSTELKVPEDGAKTISIEVFDHDKLGKDKSLGKLDLDIEDILELSQSAEPGAGSPEE